MKNNNFIDFNDLQIEDLEKLCALADDIRANREQYSRALAGRVMATLFYEPSTRTQFSFQTAMLRLGGSVIGFSDPSNSSVAKGESLKDTTKIVSGYADVIVMRSPVEGTPYAASLYSEIPVINAGDGGHLHPSQTLTDMYTILKHKKRWTDLSIGICGDLLNGRTVHSLLKAFRRFSGNTFYLISTKELALPEYVYSDLISSNNTVHVVGSIEEVIDKLDILYMTRIQKERFASAEEYERQSGIFVLDTKKMEKAKKDLCILHPLPKVDEIEDAVDDDERALYFEQAKCGMYIRMALILTLLKNDLIKNPVYENIDAKKCKNPRCVTNHEKYLPKKAKSQNDSEWVCAYCECTNEK